MRSSRSRLRSALVRVASARSKSDRGIASPEASSSSSSPSARAPEIPSPLSDDATDAERVLFNLRALHQYDPHRSKEEEAHLSALRSLHASRMLPATSSMTGCISSTARSKTSNASSNLSQLSRSNMRS